MSEIIWSNVPTSDKNMIKCVNSCEEFLYDPEAYLDDPKNNGKRPSFALFRFSDLEQNDVGTPRINPRGDLLRLDCLKGADMRMAYLENLGLGRIDLGGADLRGAHMSMARLNGANLRGANLALADLSGASLRDADLTDADLRGANLYNTNLSGANLTNADLRGAHMMGMAGVDYEDGTNLTNANLTNADLTGVYYISKVSVRYANMMGTKLPYQFHVYDDGANISDAIIEEYKEKTNEDVFKNRNSISLMLSEIANEMYR